jgi:signal transduction histidine kinase
MTQEQEQLMLARIAELEKELGMKNRQLEIEAALEKVRARSLAMQTSDDLFSVVHVLREQMGKLGQPELESSIVHVYNTAARTFRVWYAYMPPNVSSGNIIEGTGEVHADSTEWSREVFAKYGSNETEYTIVSSGQKLVEWYKVLEKLAPETVEFDEKGQLVIPNVLYYHFSKFTGGALLMISNLKPSFEAQELQRRAAVVFGLAYTRFLDLQQAEKLARQAEQDVIRIKEEKKRTEDAMAELKATQTQLVQREKMASLGEVTAGIAHEIQNPLNFVNNFSDVNKELLEELKQEVDNGNVDDAKAIADDIIRNEEKINHHGKRADAIVKGMLQHSRTNTGQKELIDINKLTDEYMRLSYFGMRAKDKSFNAEIRTDFDERIGNVNVVPQDIGRALLNIFNNAFYVVNEKTKLTANDYQPTAEVKTRRVNDKVEIIVCDNGNGIPQNIVDKIFQPFFTTKPTGQGTGLGLSLAYDIIKAHGGEIKVESKENKGTTFIIQLPVV